MPPSSVGTVTLRGVDKSIGGPDWNGLDRVGPEPGICNEPPGICNALPGGNVIPGEVGFGDEPGSAKPLVSGAP